MKTYVTLLTFVLCQVTNSFVIPPASTSNAAATTTATTTALNANDKDLLRWARANRSASADDRVVELKRPLGLVLDEDDSGNVYVETVAPRGNAARTGQVKEGDILVMCSATFGEQLWSTRGVGLTRVLAAIRVRAGPTVTLVLESPSERERKSKMTAKAAKATEEAKVRAQEKKDQLLQELQADEDRLKKGKFLGLF